MSAYMGYNANMGVKCTAPPSVQGEHRRTTMHDWETLRDCALSVTSYGVADYDRPDGKH